MHGTRRLTTLLAVLLALPLAAALPVPILAPAGDATAPAASAPAAPAFGSAAPGGDYALRFVCPPPSEDNPVLSEAPVCPAYVRDHEDVFGQPVLLVDPRHPDLMAFSAMHGGRGLHAEDATPSRRSRDDQVHQPHTTFATRDGGRAWTDMPYHAPDSLRRPDSATSQAARQVFGEDNAATLDGQGRLVLAALYAHRDGIAGPISSDAAPYHYAVATWKAKTLEQPVDYHVNLKVVPTGGDGEHRADFLHAVHVPATDLVVVLWREQPRDPEGAATLAFLWSRGSDGASWTRHDADAALADCAAVSGPVVLDAEVLVACRPREGGPVRVLAVDTAAWTTRVAGTLALDEAASHLLLIPRGNAGHVILVASGVRADAAPTVLVAYGEGGGRWSDPEEIAPRLRLVEGAPLLDARVTAAAYAPSSGALHLVFMERHDLVAANADAATAPEFTKVFAGLQAEGPFLGKVDLGVGALARGGFSPTLTGVGSGAFDDLHDSIVIWRDPAGKLPDREFVAYGDHGHVRFAKVVEENFPIPIVPLSGGVPPAPLATPGGLPIVVGLPAGLLAGAMVARTLAARRKAAVEVESE